FSSNQAILRAIDIGSNGDAGSGGSLDVLGHGVQILGTILADGSVAALGEGGGDGGDITIEAEFGDLFIGTTGDILAYGAGNDGGGGTIDLLAVGNITQ